MPAISKPRVSAWARISCVRVTAIDPVARARRELSIKPWTAHSATAAPDYNTRPVTRPTQAAFEINVRHCELPIPPQFRSRHIRAIMTAMSVETALQALRLEPRFMRNIARWEITPARPARYAPFPPELDPRLIDALAARGVTALYTHQAEAVAAALRGEHVAVVTPAASGKTLCYNLPVLNRLLADPGARALYLFPTKALAQDQLAELRELTGLLNGERETSRQVDKGGKRLQVLGASSPPLLRSSCSSAHLRDLRRRHPLGAARQDPRRGPHHPLQPRHAARRHPAAAPALGGLLRQPARRGDRRDARLSRRVRLARRQRAAPAAPHLPVLRERSAVHPGVGDHRQPRRAGRAAGRGAGDGHRPGARRRAAEARNTCCSTTRR